VVAQGNLFDCFDQRTPDSNAADHVVGARAAVRWVDGTARFPGITTSIWTGAAWVPQPDGRPIPGRMLSPRPTRTDRPFFSLQPFFEQQSYDRSGAYNAGNQSGIGRFDIALLRCCDVDGADEVAVNLHYHRGSFDFTVPPTAPIPVFAHDLGQNVANRWSGDEPAAGISRSRALISPQVTSPPAAVAIKVPVVWFVQTVPQARSHCHSTLKANGRANRGSQRGDGESGVSDEKEMAGNQNWFTSAHEVGHLDGLPDEYNERWSGAHATAWSAQGHLGVSYGEISLRANLPGDPYEPDGRDDLNPFGRPDAGMMNGNRRMRNRYFWHAAEWVRRVVNVPMRVGLQDPGGGNYPGYFLPPHATVDRTYHQWPVNARTGVTQGGGSYDLFLYALGEDHYSKGIVANGPIDGILVAVAKLALHLPTHVNPGTEHVNRQRIANVMAAAFRTRINGRWYVSGNFAGRSFRRCALHFVPQVVVENHGPPPAGVAALGPQATSMKTTYGWNFRVAVQGAAAPLAAPTWSASTSPPVAQDVLTIPIVQPPDLSVQIAPSLPRLFGVNVNLAAVTSNHWLPLVSQVMNGAAVFRLPAGASPP
jgi:hypothetical protein